MKYKCKTLILTLSLAFLSLFCLSAVELTVKATPNLFSPFLGKGSNIYNPVFTIEKDVNNPDDDLKIPLGYGGFIDPGVTLFNFLNIGPELGFYMLPKAGQAELKDDEPKNVFLIPLGAQITGVFYPFSRVELDLGIAGGSCIQYHGKFRYAPWYRAFGEAYFRINPNLSVGFNASWFDTQYTTYWGNPLAAGVSAGLSIKYSFDTEKISGEVSAEVNQNESVFPLFYTIYKDNPFGTIIIQNNETAEIRNIKVSFRAGDYTNSEIECGRVKLLKKHRREEIPLCADFSENILNFTENGKIPGEVVVEYEMLGQKRVSVSQVIIPVYNRNQVRWTDPAVIASYISTSAQEVLEFSKYLVGVARSNLRSGLNRNMQFAMYVFEGIRLAGIQCENDNSTPYIQYHLDSEVLDYIQYPYQTLLYKTGDRDDVGILLMALLQSVGIDASFITTSNDFIVCFNTGINVSKVGNLFDGLDRVLVFDDEVWIPLSTSCLGEGFINSWYNAVVEVQEAVENQEEFGFVNLTEAWSYYPPAGFSSGEHIDISSTESDLAVAVETDIARYITAEFGPQIAAVQTRIRDDGASIDLYNKLGMLYVRAGMYSSAIPVYQMSAKMGSVAAMNNLGNIASLQKKYKEAQYWYSQALEIDPENKTALKNLNRIQSELEK